MLSVVSTRISHWRFATRLAVIVVVSCSSVLGFAEPAMAYEYPWAAHTISYMYAQNVFSVPLNMCLHLEVEGTIKYERETYPPMSPSFIWRNPTIVNPQVTVDTTVTCARTSSLSYAAT